MVPHAHAAPPDAAALTRSPNSRRHPSPPAQFKFVEPEETGGRPILQYALEMAPPPLGWEGPPNPEGWFPVYAGPDRSHIVKRLQPGVRYAARVKVGVAAGHGVGGRSFAWKVAHGKPCAGWQVLQSKCSTSHILTP